MKNGLNIGWQSRWFALWWLLLAGTSYTYAQSFDTVVTYPQKELKLYDTAQNLFSPKKDSQQPYSQSKIKSRVPAGREVAQLKNDDDFWYVKSIEQFRSSPESVIYDKAQKDSLLKKNKAGARQFSQEDRYVVHVPSWVSTVIWVVIISIFLFAVAYFLLSNKINIFSRSSTGNAAIEAENGKIDLFTLPYHDLLQKAYAEKNYRFAVRILYLQTLKLLSEKNIIAFQAEYTNMDYLQQLSHTLFYKDFFAITRHYEYVWYGGFAVSEWAFSTIQKDFHTIQNKILHR